jgi:hypothetical protein
MIPVIPDGPFRLVSVAGKWECLNMGCGSGWMETNDVRRRVAWIQERTPSFGWQALPAPFDECCSGQKRYWHMDGSLPDRFGK